MKHNLNLSDNEVQDLVNCINKIHLQNCGYNDKKISFKILKRLLFIICSLKIATGFALIGVLIIIFSGNYIFLYEFLPQIQYSPISLSGIDFLLSYVFVFIYVFIISTLPFVLFFCCLEYFYFQIESYMVFHKKS